MSIVESNLRRVVAPLSMAVLAMMSLLPFAEIAGRLVFGRGVPGSIALVQHATLWVAFLGAALAASSGRLLALATADALPDRFRSRLSAVTSMLTVAITVALAAASVELIRVEREAGEVVALGIPLWVVLLVMPAGLGLVAMSLVARCEGLGARLLATSGALLPALMTAAAPWRESDVFIELAFGAVAAGAALGMPIYAGLTGAALLAFWSADIPTAAVAAEAYRLAAQPMLPAVPLFTVAGFLLAEGGASRRLLRTFSALVGFLPGGLGIVSVLVLAFFTPLTGASGVTILSMGGLFLPVLLKARYPEGTSVGLVTVSGSIGLLFAPSLPVILYGVYAHVPIPDLFVGGLLPGIVLVLVVAGYAAASGTLAGAERHAFDLREALAAVWETKWELMLPVALLASLLGGYATLVEASALTVLYALVVERVLYRDLSLRGDVPRVLTESATLAGGFLLILATALGFTNYLIHAEVPTSALAWVRGHIDSPLVFLLALNLLLIVVGALMDIYSAIFIFVPLIAPMGVAYGIDPVHLGVVFLANMELGYLMPPMGENLFLSSYRFEKPLGEVYRSTAPYVLILLAAVLLITYVPSLTLGPLSLFR